MTKDKAIQSNPRLRGRWSAWILLLCAAVAMAGCAGTQTKQDLQVAEATRGIGEAYMRQGDYASALRELLKAKELNPQDPITYNDLGLSYMAKNLLPDAIAHFKKAIELKPSYAPARNNLGTAYLIVEEYDAAIEVFKEITKDVLYATPHYPLSNLGFAYFQKGDYAKALDYYREALNLQPDFVNALAGAGNTYLKMNQPRLALRYLEPAARQAPRAAEIHFSLAEAYLLTGQGDQARTAYLTVIDLASRESDLSAKARQRLGMAP